MQLGGAPIWAAATLISVCVCVCDICHMYVCMHVCMHACVHFIYIYIICLSVYIQYTYHVLWSPME